MAGWSPDELRVAFTAETRRGAIAALIRRLEGLGLRVTARGAVTASARCPRSRFRHLFGDAASGHGSGPASDGSAAERRPRAPAAASLRARGPHVQPPHIHFRAPLFPPRVAYHHLRVPGDLAAGLNAARAHRLGITGRRVRVAVIDSGFHLEHPFFVAAGYRARVVLAPGATSAATDPVGHGTGVCANLLAVAPDAEVIGVKLDDDRGGRGASVLEGFQTALALDPRIISLSVGYDLAHPGTRTPLSRLPEGLRALEAEIDAAAARGIVVVAAAGNGHLSFPGMMPAVIAAGGVYADEYGELRPSDYASAFRSRIYPGREVPDVCGLVGMARNHADYIMLPVPPGSRIDRRNAAHDGTGRGDGWSVFSGTSSAAPQVAGVCALLIQSDPGLTPGQIARVLRSTARRGLADAHAALSAL
jgi:subtilisin family serine protease